MSTKTKPQRAPSAAQEPTRAPAPANAGAPRLEPFGPLKWRANTLEAHTFEQLLLGIETAAEVIGTDLQRMLAIVSHPMFPVLCSAIEQATHGKGERHGGNATPFLMQPWAHYARLHGRGFLTGQAAKKLEEAAHQRQGDAYVHETRGAIVYAAMSILHEQGATSVGD